MTNTTILDLELTLASAVKAARAREIQATSNHIDAIAEALIPESSSSSERETYVARLEFSRAAYGLIDVLLEQERLLRAKALRSALDANVLEEQVAKLWEQASLYNSFQLLVHLRSRKSKSPVFTLTLRARRGEFGDPEAADFDIDRYEVMHDEAYDKEAFWGGDQEVDQLTLFFNATRALPRNSIRALLSDADSMLRAICSDERLASKGRFIAITSLRSSLSAEASASHPDFDQIFENRLRQGVGAGLVTYDLQSWREQWVSNRDGALQVELAPIPTDADAYSDEVMALVDRWIYDQDGSDDLDEHFIDEDMVPEGFYDMGWDVDERMAELVGDMTQADPEAPAEGDVVSIESAKAS